MARQLWLLRHGDAEPHGARPDPERRLTERGERQARAAGLALVRLEAHIDLVLTSPKVRALDTARLAAAAWDAEPEVYAPLAEGFDGRAALEMLHRVDVDGRVLVVGHEPDLSQTVADLAGGRVDLKKGGLAVVRVEGAGGELLVLVRPRELERIADPAAAPA
jgi:phosphohistidine phosphatase